MVKIFITGSSGQIGSILVEYIIKEKKCGIKDPQDILCLVRSPDKSPFLIDLRITIFKGTLKNRNLINQIMQDDEIKFVFHIAAYVKTYAKLEELYKANVVGTKNMLDAFIQSKASHFIFSSSISVYKGYLSKEKFKVFDENSPLGTLDPNLGDAYAITKRLCELEIQKYAQNFPAKKFIVGRLGPSIGPRDRLILPAITKIIRYKVPKLINKGKDAFSLTPSLEIARALVFLAEYKENISGEFYNIVKNSETYKQVFTYFAEYYERLPPKFSIPYWLFNLVKPVAKIFKKIKKNNIIIQTILSETALNYIGKTTQYKCNKIQNLGYEFKIPLKSAIISGLKEMDPNKADLKPSSDLYKKIIKTFSC